MVKAITPAVALSLLLPCLLAGCYVSVDKNKNGDGKDVSVRLPGGGVHVQENTPSAQDIGLPTYPGASLVGDQHGGKSANVHVGFGEWQMHLQIARYQTADPQSKVEAFYRSALGQYGQVVHCRDGHAIDTATISVNDLGCEDRHTASNGIHIGDEEVTGDLRAGSKHHQHIVGFSPGSGNGTRFTLIRLDLPSDLEESDKPE